MMLQTLNWNPNILTEAGAYSRTLGQGFQSIGPVNPGSLDQGFQKHWANESRTLGQCPERHDLKPHEYLLHYQGTD